MVRSARRPPDERHHRRPATDFRYRWLAELFAGRPRRVCTRQRPQSTKSARQLRRERFFSPHIATLLFDLLTPDEEGDRRNVFDIPLLADRLIDAIDWVDRWPAVAGLPLGLFGASTGAAAALVAAARLGDRVSAVVSRGGRPDLADKALEGVEAPTLLIVGGADTDVIDLNEQALARLKGPKRLQIVPGATHLFSEPGALDAVTDHAARWFQEHLRRAA